MKNLHWKINFSSIDLKLEHKSTMLDFIELNLNNGKSLYKQCLDVTFISRFFIHCKGRVKK